MQSLSPHRVPRYWPLFVANTFTLLLSLPISQFAMRFTLTLVAAASAFSAATASIYSRQSLPCTVQYTSFFILCIHLVCFTACALSCMENANYGSCSQEDNACLCRNTEFVSSTTACIEKACDASDLAAAEQYSQALCDAVVRSFCKIIWRYTHVKGNIYRA